MHAHWHRKQDMQYAPRVLHFSAFHFNWHNAKTLENNSVLNMHISFGTDLLLSISNIGSILKRLTIISSHEPRVDKVCIITIRIMFMGRAELELTSRKAWQFVLSLSELNCGNDVNSQTPPTVLLSNSIS